MECYIDGHNSCYLRSCVLKLGAFTGSCENPCRQEKSNNLTKNNGDKTHRVREFLITLSRVPG